MRGILTTIAVLCAAGVLTIGSAAAQGRSGFGRGHAPAFGQAGQFSAGQTTGWGSSAYPPGFGHGNKRGWGSANTPPGWSHGRRRGWQGRSTPPGWNR